MSVVQINATRVVKNLTKSAGRRPAGETDSPLTPLDCRS